MVRNKNLYESKEKIKKKYFWWMETTSKKEIKSKCFQVCHKKKRAKLAKIEMKVMKILNFKE